MSINTSDNTLVETNASGMIASSLTRLKRWFIESCQQGLWLGVILITLSLVSRSYLKFDAMEQAHWTYLVANAAHNPPLDYALILLVGLSLWLPGAFLLKKRHDKASNNPLVNQPLDTAKTNVPGSSSSEAENTDAGAAKDDGPSERKPKGSYLGNLLSNTLDTLSKKDRARRNSLIETAKKSETKTDSGDKSPGELQEKTGADTGEVIGTDFTSLNKIASEDNSINILSGPASREYSIFHDLRRTKSITNADLAGCIHMWLRDRAWQLRPELIINGDMGATAFEEDGFSALPHSTVPMLALDGEGIRLFSYLSPKGQTVTTPSAKAMMSGPLMEWLLSADTDEESNCPCPVSILMMARNRLIRSYGEIIEEIYGSTDCIRPTLVLGECDILNSEELVSLVELGDMDIIHFMTPGSVPDMLGDNPAEISTLQNGLLQEIIAGESHIN